MDAATRPHGDATAAERRVPTAAIGAGAIAVAVALVGCATWLVGPAPRSADDGLPQRPPPLALPTGTPTDAPVARAAVKLASGDLDGAREGFVDLVADQPDDVPGQVGLALSKWNTTGPDSVEGSLRQLALEYPESAFVSLHLGLVQTLLDDPRLARVSLRDAVRLGRATTDPTQLRMASVADDVLHPEAFRGSMPVLVSAQEVAPAARPKLRRLLAAVSIEDRRTAATVGLGLDDSADPMLRVAAIAATFSKEDTDAVAERLDAVAADANLTPAARDRARLQAALARLWGGGERSVGCARLAGLADATTQAATRRIAAPIHGELCG